MVQKIIIFKILPLQRANLEKSSQKKINKQSIFYHYQIETKPRVSEIQDLRIASIYGVFLVIISDIYTTISVFA
jgi:hypothetical protein